jgi:hypothetical protein
VRFDEAFLARIRGQAGGMTLFVPLSSPGLFMLLEAGRCEGSRHSWGNGGGGEKRSYIIYTTYVGLAEVILPYLYCLL